MTPTSIAAYLALFAAVGFLFLFVSLLLGRLLRADAPSAEKLQPYECGEPPIGSSFVQFDLRFYVVALVFIIFEVEVAFFFPWATVFGKATRLMDPNLSHAEVRQTYQQLGVAEPELPPAWFEGRQGRSPVADNARDLALAAMADIGVFFGVLLVGFAYLWRRGDLNWVRAIGHPPVEPVERTEPY